MGVDECAEYVDGTNSSNVLALACAPGDPSCVPATFSPGPLFPANSGFLGECATASMRVLDCEMIQRSIDQYANMDGVNYCNCEGSQQLSYSDAIEDSLAGYDAEQAKINCSNKITNPCKNSNGVPH